MRLHIFTLSFFLLFALPVVIFTACKKEHQNIAPVAYAGTNKIICFPVDSVELSGKGTDLDGSIVSYEWRKTIGPAHYTLENSTTAVAMAKNLVEGQYVFEFKVTDNQGLSSTDAVIITVSSDTAACNPNFGYWDY